MEAGRELDALVAEKVMGWRIFEKYADWIGIPIGREPYPALVWNYSNPPGWLLWSQDKKDAKIWSPSTDIAAAWQVVEKLIAGGLRIHLYYESLLDWRCVMHRESDFVTEFADTAPLAICLAALKTFNISTN